MGDPRALDRTLTFKQQDQRVDDSLRDGNRLVDSSSSDFEREEGKLLHERMLKLAESVQALNEWVMGTAEHALEHSIETLLAEKIPHSKISSLAQLASALQLASGLLILSDGELLTRAAEARAVTERVGVYSELVKGSLELAGGAAGVVAMGVSFGAKLVGNAELARYSAGVAATVGQKLGTVIAVIDVVHGLALAVGNDPHRRLDGAVETIGGGLALAGKRKALTGVALPAAAALTAGYAELKIVASMYWQSGVGLSTGLLRPALESLKRSGDSIADASDALSKAIAIQQAESDPERRDALDHVVTAKAKLLSNYIDSLIDKGAPVQFEAGVAAHPGAHRVLRELIEPLRPYRGATAPTAVLGAAVLSLQRLEWAFAHVGELATTSARGQGLAEAQTAVQEAETMKKKEHE